MWRLNFHELSVPLKPGPVKYIFTQIYKEYRLARATLSFVQDLICTERLRRADAVTKARKAVHEAKSLRDRMSLQGVYVARYDSLLSLAKAVQSEAMAELRKHRKEHRC